MYVQAAGSDLVIIPQRLSRPQGVDYRLRGYLPGAESGMTVGLVSLAWDYSDDDLHVFVEVLRLIADELDPVQQEAPLSEEEAGLPVSVTCFAATSLEATR